jgi:drug/metabolite transporter (DMT)-like permease
MVSVATPVVALAVSTAFEGYRPDALTAIGVALAIGGNLLASGVGRRPGGPAQAPRNALP